jgi:uncharacterized protein DUF5063
MTQTDPPTIAAVRDYFDAVEGGPVLTLRELARAIDALVMAVHETPAGDPADSELSPPERDYQSDYRRLAERYKSLGYYGVAEPLVLEPSSATIGDAIDDLADIGSDLRKVLWRFETQGADDAFWHFHLHFLFHWGQHARELSLYLHALIRAED